MVYTLNLKFNLLQCHWATEPRDEIYLFGVGSDQRGNLTFLPLRKMESINTRGFQKDSVIDNEGAEGDRLMGTSNLLSVELPGIDQLGYNVILWLIESDNASRLNERVQRASDDLRQVRNYRSTYLTGRNYPNETSYLQAMADCQINFHRLLTEGIAGGQSVNEVFMPQILFFGHRYDQAPGFHDTLTLDPESQTFIIKYDYFTNTSTLASPNYSMRCHWELKTSVLSQDPEIVFRQ